MDTTVRSTSSGQPGIAPQNSNTESANNYVEAFRNTSGSLDVNKLISSARKDLDQGDINGEFIKQVEDELQGEVHPFDQAQFRNEFKAELGIKDTLIYQGKPIAVGSAIDRSQQIPEYAKNALFRHTNEKGVVEITNKFAFIDPPAEEKAMQTPANAQVDSTCSEPFEKLASLKLSAAAGRKGIEADSPEAKVIIHDGKTENDPGKFALGDEGNIGNVSVQLMGYAKNTVDEGTVSLNEKGAVVTSYGIEGRSGFELASVENESKTANADLNAFDTEFEAKAEVHLDAKTGTFKGAQSSAEVNLNLLGIKSELEHQAKIGDRDIKLKVSSEVQAGPGIKVEVNTEALKKGDLVNLDASIFRGKIELEIEARKNNCD